MARRVARVACVAFSILRRRSVGKCGMDGGWRMEDGRQAERSKGDLRETPLRYLAQNQVQEGALPQDRSRWRGSHAFQFVPRYVI